MSGPEKNTGIDPRRRTLHYVVPTRSEKACDHDIHKVSEDHRRTANHRGTLIADHAIRRIGRRDVLEEQVTRRSQGQYKR